MEFITMCQCCKRLQGPRQCEAFAVIPEAIWHGDDEHFDPRPGDHGRRYALDDRARELAEAYVQGGVFSQRLVTQRE